MRLTTPRIAPLTDDELNPEQQAAVESFARRGRVLNIFRTLVRAPAAIRAFLAWGNYVLSDDNDLPPREREIVILRTGWQCRSGYEWTQHVRIGLRAGVTAGEVDAIKRGSADPRWSDVERALLDATDELVADHFISDTTWARLSPLSEKQRMDLVFTVGQYTQVSMILNSFGVPLDAGQELDPEFPR